MLNYFTYILSFLSLYICLQQVITHQIFLEQGESIIFDETFLEYDATNFVFNETIEYQGLTNKIKSISLFELHPSNITQVKFYHTQYLDNIYVLLNNENNSILVNYELKFTKENNTIVCTIQSMNQLVIANSSNCMDFTFLEDAIFILCFCEIQKSLNLIQIKGNQVQNTFVQSSQQFREECAYSIENVESEIFIFSCFNTQYWKIDKISLQNSIFKLHKLISNSNMIVKYKTHLNSIYLYSKDIVQQYNYQVDKFVINSEQYENDIIDLQINSNGSYQIITQQLLNNITQNTFKSQDNLKLLYYSKEMHYNILFNNSIIINNQYFKYIDQIDQIYYIDNYKILMIINKNNLELHQFNYYKGLITKREKQIQLFNLKKYMEDISFVQPIRTINHELYHHVKALGENLIKIEFNDIALFDMEIYHSLLNLNTSISYDKQNLPIIRFQGNSEWEILLTIKIWYSQTLKQEWIICQQGQLIIALLDTQNQSVIQQAIISKDCQSNDQIFYYYDLKGYLLLFIYNAQLNKLQFINIEGNYLRIVNKIYELDGSKIEYINQLDICNLFIINTKYSIYQINIQNKQIEKIKDQLLRIQEIRFYDHDNYFYFRNQTIYIYNLKQTNYLNSLSFDTNIYKKVEDIIILEKQYFIVIIQTKTNLIELIHYKLTYDYQFIFLKKLPTNNCQIIIPIIIKFDRNRLFTIEALDQNQTVILLYLPRQSQVLSLRQCLKKISNHYLIIFESLSFIFESTIQISNKKYLLINQIISSFNNQAILQEKLTIKINNFNTLFNIAINYFDFTNSFQQLKQSIDIIIEKQQQIYSLNITEIVQGIVMKVESNDFEITPPFKILNSNINNQGSKLFYYEEQLYTVNQDSQIVKIMNNSEISPTVIDYKLPFNSTYLNYAFVVIDSKEYIFLIYEKLDKKLFILINQLQEGYLRFVQLIEIETIYKNYCIQSTKNNLMIFYSEFVAIYTFSIINRKIQVNFYEVGLPFQSEIIEIIEINQMGFYLFVKHEQSILIKEFNFTLQCFEQLQVIPLESRFKQGQSKIIQLNSYSLIVAYKFHNLIDVIQYMPQHNKIATIMSVQQNIFFQSINLVDIDQNNQAIIYYQFDNDEYQCLIHIVDKKNKDNRIYPIQFIQNCKYDYIITMPNNFILLITDNGEMQSLTLIKIQNGYQITINNNKVNNGSLLIINPEQQFKININFKFEDIQLIYLIIIIFHLVLYLSFAYQIKNRYNEIQQQ